MTDPGTLRKLQGYIYKRPQDQTADDVFAHIEKAHAKDPLSDAEWVQLMIPACSNPDAEVVRWLGERGSPSLEDVGELMRATVGSREERLEWAERRIEVLAVLASHLADGDTEPLSQALTHACWFNDIGSAAWLIQHGADIHHTSWNAVREADVDCLANAEIYGERTGDFTLRDYLKLWYDDKTPLGDWRALYSRPS